MVKEFVASLSLSPLRCKRKWSVRKLRRRARSGERRSPPPGLALVGEELDTAPLPGCIEISSGEESTEGEDSTGIISIATLLISAHPKYFLYFKYNILHVINKEMKSCESNEHLLIGMVDS